MAEITAETFAQRAFDANLVDAQQLEAAWSELGSRNVPVEDVQRLLVRKELLTNYQVGRLLKGERHGYFWGAYKILYLVGSGTFARVYRAAHTESGQVVAVKVLRRRYVDDAKTKEQFFREARLVMELRHPNIVPVYDVGEEQSRNYMVMEFVEGQNLRDFLKVRKKFSVLESLRLLIDVASGLEYALQRGLTHRDLKLSNVLLSADGSAKLVDFGVAAIAALAAESGHGAARSIDYAGLERASGVRKDDPRSDIYFTGCMLYHLLTGQPPLVETRERIRRLDVSRYRDVKPILEWEPDLPRSVVSLVTRAMDIQADRRFPTPGEMLAELKRTVTRVKAGDVEPATAPQADAPEEPGETPGDKQGASDTVMVVESNVEMQDRLRAALKRRGYRVLVISDPQRALGRFTPGEPAAACVLFCASDLGEAALEAFNRFATEEPTREIPAVLLVDQDQQDMISKARLADHRLSMSLPVKLGELCRVMRDLLAASAGDP
jgi:serine/threonine protein kinase